MAFCSVGMTSAVVPASSCTGSAACASQSCGHGRFADDRIDSQQFRCRAKHKPKTSSSTHCAP